MQLILDETLRSQHVTCDENLKLHAQLSQQGIRLKSMQSGLQKSLRDSAKYHALYEILRDERFVGTSQQFGKSRPEAGRDDGKGEWDLPYRTKEGRLVTCFYPLKKLSQGSSVPEMLSKDVCFNNEAAGNEESPILSNFPVTHATVDMLVEFGIHAYMLETPVYRDMIRLFELKFNFSRQTILNWLLGCPVLCS